MTTQEWFDDIGVEIDEFKIKVEVGRYWHDDYCDNCLQMEDGPDDPEFGIMLVTLSALDGRRGPRREWCKQCAERDGDAIFAGIARLAHLGGRVEFVYREDYAPKHVREVAS